MRTDNPTLTCGIEIGAGSIEIVLLRDRERLFSLVQNTGISPSQNGEAAFRETLRKADVNSDDICGIVSTGYGRNYFELAHRSVSEIVCHTKRTLCMTGRTGIEPDVVFTGGGVAKIAGIWHALAGGGGFQPLIPPDPQITGAL